MQTIGRTNNAAGQHNNSHTTTTTKRKKKLQDIVEIKPLSEVKPGKVLLFAGTGLFLGAVVGVLSQIAKLDLKGDGTQLDPPAPNMQNIEPEMVVLFKKFMGPFYRLCPDENKNLFRSLVQKAIRNAESVMLIETQLIHEEIPKVIKHATEASAHARICMRALRDCESAFYNDLLANVRDAADVVFILIAQHINNIRIITSSI